MSEQDSLLSKIKQLEKNIALREGRAALTKWRFAKSSLSSRLQKAGIELADPIGCGGRGQIWQAESEQGAVAIKLFAYQEERDPQARALQFWQGLAPQVFAELDQDILVLELLESGDLLADHPDGLRIGLGILNKMQKLSPADRPDGSTLARESFLVRINRARQRNAISKLYPERYLDIAAEKLNICLSENQVCHGDFGGNIMLSSGVPRVYDPRDFIWGNIELDVAKWIIYCCYNRQFATNLNLIIDSYNYDQKLLLSWILIQALDDSIAFCHFQPDDPRISAYQQIVEQVINRNP
jgi:hypothetical protein